ncbi:MAG: hypothetical protein IJJ26_00320 [Victivallales bacterium]|nr:hypothetical protein [Victivallales bacterium]
MKQTASILSVYAADTSGACSALYELGGMSVIHDASGCNSTYTTHDEPRWYHQDSMVFLTGLTEADAILGNDEKLVGDLVQTAMELRPRFIALCGSPVPMMVGTDYDALAIEVRLKTGIPCFGIHSDGMHSYLHGASQAFLHVCEEFCETSVPRNQNTCNILGLTPLDFSTNGSVQKLRNILERNGFRVIAPLGMDCTLEEVSQMGSASVNLVVSHAGLATAQWFQERFGIPWVAGVPVGTEFSRQVLMSMQSSAQTGKCAVPCAETRHDAAQDAPLVVGEAIFAGSLAAALETETGAPVRILCPLEHDASLLRKTDSTTEDEDEIAALFTTATGVVADPLYRPVCPATVPFHPLPHEAYSGRCYRHLIPDLIGTPIAPLLAAKENVECFVLTK